MKPIAKHTVKVDREVNKLIIINKNQLFIRENFLSLGLKLTLVIGGFILFLGRAWAGEDAFIFFRYVNNFLGGYGLVFNLGERVEGFTAPLWVIVLSFLHLITGFELRPLSIFFGLFLSALAIFLILFLDNSHRLFIPLGVLLLITSSAFRDFATSGFETSLTYLLLVSFALLVKKELAGKYACLTGLLLALLVLNRPEAFLLFLYLTVWWLLRIVGELLKKQKLPAVQLTKELTFFAVPAGVILSAYQLFRMGYYASFFPNTFYAKKGGELYLSQGLNYLIDFLRSYPFSMFLIFIGVFLILRGVISGNVRDQYRYGRLHLVLMAILLIFYILYSGGDYMHGRSLLMAFILLCLAVNDIFEVCWRSFVSSRAVPLSLSILAILVFSVVVALVGLVQKPVSVIAGKQVNRINDERYHFAFQLVEPAEFKSYLKESITGNYGWASRGSYYRDVANEVGLPVSVVMGNIGFFGYAAGGQVSVSGVSLIDAYLARYPVVKRGTVGHEGEAHYDYVFFRRPNFAYTPFKQWNASAQFRYSGSSFAGIIKGDSDDSFIPIFDLSNESFIRRFSALVGADVKGSIDEGQRAYLEALGVDGQGTNPQELSEYFGFLNLYWAPYASETDRGLLQRKRHEIFGDNLLSTYEVFFYKSAAVASEYIERTSGRLAPDKFFSNVVFAAKDLFRKTNQPPVFFTLSKESDLKRPEVTATNIIYNRDYSFFYAPAGYQSGQLSFRFPNKKVFSNQPYVMELSYRALGKGNSLRVSCFCGGTEKMLFAHSTQRYGDTQNILKLYIDVTVPLQQGVPVDLLLDRPTGPAPFEVAVDSVRFF